MAKRSGSKSEAIRNYIAANPDAKPKQIHEALNAQGIAVSMGLVSVVKYSKPKKPSSKSRATRTTPASATGASADELKAADLVAAKQLVDSLGGISQTREALELLERLR